MEVKRIKKTLVISATILIVAFTMSIITPALSENLYDNNVSLGVLHRLPPGHMLSPDFANDQEEQNIVEIQTDLGYPDYDDCSVFKLNSLGGYTGIYGYLSPQAIELETDWWTTTQEYWVQISVHDSSSGTMAEIGLDILLYEDPWWGWTWATVAFAGYAENGNSYVLDYYVVGTSPYGPEGAALGVYKISGSNWGWNVNGYQFTTYSFSNSWTGYKTHCISEAYNQPASGTSDEFIMGANGLYIKRASDGWWDPALYNSAHADNGVHNGWDVELHTNDGARVDWSTRT